MSIVQKLWTDKGLVHLTGQYTRRKMVCLERLLPPWRDKSSLSVSGWLQQQLPYRQFVSKCSPHKKFNVSSDLNNSDSETPQCLGNFLDVNQGDIPFTALDSSNIRPIESPNIRKFLLRNPSLFAPIADCSAEPNR